MLFEEVHSVWTERRLTQEEAGQLLGICPRTFRRWAGRCKAHGIEGLRTTAVTGISPGGAGGRGDADGDSRNLVESQWDSRLVTRHPSRPPLGSTPRMRKSARFNAMIGSVSYRIRRSRIVSK